MQRAAREAIDQKDPKRKNSVHHRFASFASKVALWCGSPSAFGIAFGLVLVWGISGPYFQFSENWQIVINTGTTIITFLMVFVIQSSQNRDGMALQLKLDEIIRALEGARNRIVDTENMDEKELERLRQSFRNLAKDETRCDDDDGDETTLHVASAPSPRPAKVSKTKTRSRK